MRRARTPKPSHGFVARAARGLLAVFTVLAVVGASLWTSAVYAASANANGPRVTTGSERNHLIGVAVREVVRAAPPRATGRAPLPTGKAARGLAGAPGGWACAGVPALTELSGRGIDAPPGAARSEAVPKAHARARSMVLLN